MVKLGGHRPKARRAVGPWLLGGLLLPLLFGLATTARYEWSQLLLGRWQSTSSASGGSSSTGGRRHGATTRARGSVPAEVKERCRGTLGRWCEAFWMQVPVPARTAPRGSETCNLDCNGVGSCSALTGLCTCPAGWTGWNCLHPMKRPCSNAFRFHGFDPPRRHGDLEAGMRAGDFWVLPFARCAGFCDDTVAACYCPADTRHGRIPAGEDAPQGAPPRRAGRPMGLWCQPNRLPNGSETHFGSVDPEQLFGPEGWCNADQPQQSCECYMDGWGGPHCDQPYEQVCLNQCNGRGECLGGYCKCDPGWHGIDCAHRSADADASRPGREAGKPWVAAHVHTPAAREFPPGATRRRPLIYVYDLPSDFNQLMLQYRYGGEACVARYYNLHNSTLLSNFTYAAEAGFLEALLQSEHRTLDPEEADFFFAPVFPSCLAWPIRRTSDSLRDMWYGVLQLRPAAAANMLLEAYHWVRAHHPYWARRGGRDHVWLVTHDEASCYVPDALRPSIILSHWGRRDAPHNSSTGYWEDAYHENRTHIHWDPHGPLSKVNLSTPCYDPHKDLILPSFKPPYHFHASPLVGAPARPRTMLAFHRGRVQLDNPPFSRGIRQTLYKLCKEEGWKEKHRVFVVDGNDLPGDYSQQLASSEFCLVLMGDGWTARMEDAVLHGCLPVIIMDDVDASLASVVDLSAFSLRVAQKDLARLPQILAAVPPARRDAMRAALARVWHRFQYGGYRAYGTAFREVQHRYRGSASSNASQPASQPVPVRWLDPARDDAFSTVMAWLYSRIDATR